MKVLLASLLVIAMSYQASAAYYRCPTISRFYDYVIECTDNLASAGSVTRLCRYFTGGYCLQVSLVYENNCGDQYDNDELYTQIEETVKSVKTLCA